MILKLVNVGEDAKSLRIEFAGGDSLSDEAECTILAGDPLAVNEFGTRKPLLPKASRISAGETIEFEAPPHSFSVLRIKSR